MKTSKKYIGACMLGLTALAVASCSDTWDEHYNTVEDSVPTQSLWDIISSNPDMSNFAELAEQVHYYRDEKHPQLTYTFRDMLAGKQAITAWVPTNDALTETEWESLRQTAKNNPYSVQQQLLANSIALWRRVVSSAGNDTITMINGKKYIFDKSALTMGGQLLKQGAYNIAASNGTLHTVTSPLAFNFNLYEYLKDTENAAEQQITALSNIIISNDTTYFSSSSSIEGAPDINGNPTYVDSVYFTSNNLFFGRKRYPGTVNTEQYLTYDEGFGAYINAEDSAFVMLIPTDQAWQEAKEMLTPYYKYSPVYLDNDELDENPSYKGTRQVANVDSLVEKNINMDILSPLVFNLNMQPNASGRIGTWKMDDFLSNGEQASHFLNTYGDTLRSDADWQKSTLLQGKQVAMSNGVGILADKWNFPQKFYKPDVIVEANMRSIYQYDNATYTMSNVSFSNTIAEDWIDSVGRVTNDNFLKFRAAANSRLTIDFKLQGNEQEIYETEVMSGKYDIYVVLVPAFYETSGQTADGDTLLAKVNATLSYNNGAKSGANKSEKTKETYIYTGEKVDTVLLFQDFEFPYSYKNLLYSYPTLQIEAARPSTREQAQGYRAQLCIDRIILKSKD